MRGAESGEPTGAAPDSPDSAAGESDPNDLDAYHFVLPESQIAQAPAERREASRLLVLERASGTVEDRRFCDLPDLLDPGDLLVLNDTRVFPARLRGRRRPTGGQAELLLVDQRPDGSWEALARPGRRLTRGAKIDFGDGRLTATIDDVLEGGRRIVAFDSAEPFWDVIEAVGEPPLPPYIRRTAGAVPSDAERYQTVYARERGAVAAPTAGLHFTPELLDRIRGRGIEVASVTLHVGYGTFEPVRVRDLRMHRVAAERYSVPPETARAIAATRLRGGHIVAVGTTTTRALESAAHERGRVAPGPGLAELTITPGYRFRVVDSLLTNFHLPRSSLLVLAGTFAGREALLAAYGHAVAAGYRFYSYGDAMLIR